MGTPHWKEVARAKRQAQAASIPAEWRLSSIPTDFVDCRPVIESCGLLSADELLITNMADARLIAERIRFGNWTSEIVTTAFCKRAAIAQQLIGCCTEMFFLEAIQHAKWLDQYLARTGKPFGPLHGVPLSIKDNYEVKDVDTTVGWVGLIGQPATDDNLAVKQLRALGAVLYCKTNIPQSLMMSDSYNHVFGQSVNALNRRLVSGGSSGGEGALVGARGSILGIGTDIGGSIRIPAALQGLYGLNPSTGRVPNRESGRHQKHVVPPVAGPLATHLSSIELFMEAYLSSKPWESDPTILPIPWRSELAVPPRKPLKLGFVFDDGAVRPQPPIARTTREIMNLFRDAGHEVFEWDTSSHPSAYYDLWLRSVLSDGGQRCADLCKLIDEPLIEGMLVGRPEHTLTVAQRQELADKVWEYQAAYQKRWTESSIDAIVMPILPWVGFRPKTWVKSDQYCGLTAHWNLLNYAALAVPTGITVDRNLDQPDASWSAHQPRSFADEFNHDQYDIELVEGMPVGLQIVGGRFGEEKVVAVAKVLSDLLSSKPDRASVMNGTSHLASESALGSRLVNGTT